MRREDQTAIMATAFATAHTDTDTILPAHIARLASVLDQAGQLSPDKLQIRIGKGEQGRSYTFTSIGLPEKNIQLVSLNLIADHVFVMPYPNAPKQMEDLARVVHAYNRIPYNKRPYIQNALSELGEDVSVVRVGEGFPMWKIKLLSEIDVEAASLKPVSDDFIRDALNDEAGPVFTDPALENV